MAEITFIGAVIDDLRKIGPDAVPKVFKKIRLLIDEPTAGYPLGGELVGYRKLVVGPNTWRIIYRINQDSVVEICEIWGVGARAESEIHSEVKERVKNSVSQTPEIHALTGMLERLGRLAGDIEIAQKTAPRELVPDWLAQRLIFTAGIPSVEVAALSLEEAVDRWTEFTLKPH